MACKLTDNLALSTVFLLGLPPSGVPSYGGWLQDMVAAHAHRICSKLSVWEGMLMAGGYD